MPRRKRGRIEESKSKSQGDDEEHGQSGPGAVAPSDRGISTHPTTLCFSGPGASKGTQQKKAELDAKVVQIFYQREKEEQRAKNEEFEAKFIGLDVEDGEKELHQVKQEITKLNAQIFEEQQKAQSADKAIREGQEKYQVELKTKALREQQKKTMTALLAGKDEAISSLEGRFYKLKREAKAAKQLLEKEEEKAAQQEQAAEKEMEIERRKRLEGEGTH